MAKTGEPVTVRQTRVVQKEPMVQSAWEAKRCERLLRAMALANQLNVPVQVSYKHNQLGYKFDLTGFNQWESVSSMDEWIMDCIDNQLADMLKRQQRKEYLKKVKAELLNTLTDDQKEALGLI